MNEFLNIANKVPSGFFALLAAALALAGVVITIIVQGKRLTTQLRHDRDLKDLQLQHDRALKDREREMATKKEIFFSAAEAFSAGIHSLSKYNDPNISNTDVIADFVKKSSAIARLYVIGSTDTVLRAVSVMDAIGVAQLKMASMRDVLMNINQSLATADFLCERSAKERDHVFDLTKDFHLTLQNSTEKRERLDHAFNYHRDKVDEFHNLKMARFAELHAQQVKMIRAWQQERSGLLAVLLPAILALRQELELPIDVETIESVMESSKNTSQEAIEAYLSGFTKNIDTHTSS